MKVRIFSAEGYAGLNGIEFPVVVDASSTVWCGERCMAVSEKELARIGADAYQPDEIYTPSAYRCLYFYNYEVL